jgi:4-hydroxymandelate oxidase
VTPSVVIPGAISCGNRRYSVLGYSVLVRLDQEHWSTRRERVIPTALLMMRQGDPMTTPVTDPLDDGVLAVTDLEPMARERLAREVWDYLACGAGDQRTIEQNIEGWQAPPFAPHVMTGLRDIDTSSTLLGRRMPHPILFAPTALQTNYHPDGEAATMRAAIRTGTTYVQSTLSGVPLDQLGDISRSAPAPDGEAAHWWFQTYLHHDRGFTRSLVESAVTAGSEAIVLTVDSPVLGARDNDRRNGWGAMPEDGIRIHERILNPFLASDISWADLDWLVDLVGDVPVLVKGVLRADDATEAIEHGAAGVIVSNHGARNLDTIVPTALALPAIADAVGGRATVLVDGGIRRGTDVARALCRGADAVLIGRPYIWGLATHGEAGVAHVAQILRAELAMAMGLVGATRIVELTPGLLWPPR